MAAALITSTKVPPLEPGTKSEKISLEALARLNRYARMETAFAFARDRVYPEPPSNAHSLITKLVYQRTKDIAPLPAEARILDIGCGQGVALQHFVADGHKATGIAIGEDVAVCRAKGYDVVEMDMTFLDFEDATFDMVWARHVLEHSVIPLFTLGEIMRVLKPGGVLYVETPAPDTCARHEFNPNHYSVFGRRMLQALLERVGFGDIVHFDVKVPLAMGDDLYFCFVSRRP
jgi:SAM-dependent methyltransferase